MRLETVWRFLATAVFLLTPTVGFAADEAAPEFSRAALTHFEMEVRPLLAKHCWSCHGAKAQKGGLRLDQRTALLTGGESGPAVVPGAPQESLLLEAVRRESFEMPPDETLEPNQIAALERWIQQGAAWPDTDTLKRQASGADFSRQERSWWAIQSLQDPQPPAVPEELQQRVQTPVDAFVLKALETEGLALSPPASRRTLIRRAYFDLIGLPPTPAEVAAFENDSNPKAYEVLVDRLLDDPRYGQRWARHWLDLVRYAESDGYRQDAYRPDAWRYRDYVIQSLNQDKPYHEFVREQLAADELDLDDPRTLVATQYLRMGVYEYNNRDAEGQWELMVNDLTDNVADVFLGLGLACARCHDHKFDPLLQHDYFRLQSFFSPVLWRDDMPLVPRAEFERYERELAAWEKANSELLAAVEKYEAPARRKLEKAAVEKFPDEVQQMYWKPAGERTGYENQIADLVERQVLWEYESISKGMSSEEKQKWEEARKALEIQERSKPKRPLSAAVVMDVPGQVPTAVIPGEDEPILPGIPTILDPEPCAVDPSQAARPGSSGRRLAFANWVTRPDNPLSTRVIVNRVWQYHFGRGIVASSSDFGLLGEPPTHPQLLDWLVQQFLEKDWRLKPLHRTIMLSAVYRQSAATPPSPAARMRDPQNRLLWRFPPQRLAAEQIRDAMLAVSGELIEKESGYSESASEPYRSIYTRVIRNSPDPLLESFDAPTGFSGLATRNVTTTATQSLLMLNGAWTLKRAAALAERLRNECGDDDEARVARAFALCYGREPSASELAEAVAFVQRYRSSETPAVGEATLPAECFVDHPELRRWSTAFHISDELSSRVVGVDADSPPAESGFTIEAIVYHRTMFPDASVRTIAAQWDGSTGHRGWNFGVTSAKSKYRPRNLILQLIGPSRSSGQTAYEVVASNLRIPSERPYYVAASVDFQQGTVTFYAKDMSYEESELQTVTVPHGIAAVDMDNPFGLTLGGRDNAKSPSNWDGLIDDVRLSYAVLPLDQLLLSAPEDLVTDQTWGLWRFVRSDERGVLADESGHGHHLQFGATQAARRQSPRAQALTDFCHVLLNSSEFQYVD